MPRKTELAALSSIGLVAIAAPVIAADVTSQRLVNAKDEPQNWLMIHHDYDNSRHSSLKELNRDTVKNFQLKYTFSIGGRSTGGIMRGKEESTPLVDDGYMYVTDTWSRVMKFDVRSGTEAIPLWRYDPKIRVSRTTRGLAMYDNNIFLSTYDARLIALNRDTGEVVWRCRRRRRWIPRPAPRRKPRASPARP
jgi:alcohol dehydrogenase (cytochrome c)